MSIARTHRHTHKHIHIYIYITPPIYIMNLCRKSWNQTISLYWMSVFQSVCRCVQELMSSAVERTSVRSLLHSVFLRTHSCTFGVAVYAETCCVLMSVQKCFRQVDTSLCCRVVFLRIVLYGYTYSADVLYHLPCTQMCDVTPPLHTSCHIPWSVHMNLCYNFMCTHTSIWRTLTGTHLQCTFLYIYREAMSREHISLTSHDAYAQTYDVSHTSPHSTNTTRPRLSPQHSDRTNRNTWNTKWPF